MTDGLLVPADVESDDLFGRAVEDHFLSRPEVFQWERSDGLVITQPIDVYFAPGDAAPAHEMNALIPIGKRVLDVGLGAGRHSLLLQARGHEVAGIDLSQRCVAVSRARGVAGAEVMDAFALTLPPASVDAAIFYSNNLSLGGTPEGIRALLDQVRRVLAPGGLIVSINRDVTRSANPAHLEWQRQNRAKGLFPGQIRMRPRYGGATGGWIDWLFVAPSELDDFARATDLEVAWTQQGDNGNYAALLCRRGDAAARRAAQWA